MTTDTCPEHVGTTGTVPGGGVLCWCWRAGGSPRWVVIGCVKMVIPPHYVRSGLVNGFSQRAEGVKPGSASGPSCHKDRSSAAAWAQPLSHPVVPLGDGPAGSRLLLGHCAPCTAGVFPTVDTHV